MSFACACTYQLSQLEVKEGGSWGCARQKQGTISFNSRFPGGQYSVQWWCCGYAQRTPLGSVIQATSLCLFCAWSKVLCISRCLHVCKHSLVMSTHSCGLKDNQLVTEATCESGWDPFMSSRPNIPQTDVCGNPGHLLDWTTGLAFDLCVLGWFLLLVQLEKGSH